jgi:hypothetical protein
VSDPRPPDDGPSWPEHDLDQPRPEDPAPGWSVDSDDADNPYRYEPPPPFQPSWEPMPSAASGYPPEHPFGDENPFPDDISPSEDEPGQPTPVEEEPGQEFASEVTEAEASVDEPAEPEPEQPEEPEPELEPELEPLELEPEAEPEPEPEPEPQPVPEPEPPYVEAAPPPAEDPDTESGEPVMAFYGSVNGWDPKTDGNRRRPTTAEQAVPWLIGLILALTGIVIVLLALIFTSPGGLVAGDPTATPLPSASKAADSPSTEPSGAVVESPSTEASASASAEPTPGPSPTPAPTYGALEMVYLGRPSGTAPIYLLRRDFTKAKQAQVLAQAAQGIERFTWSPDGRVGTAIISGRAVALTPGQEARKLADNVTAVTFGWDAETVYAVRITQDGADDRAQILKIDFVSGANDVVANVRYPHPVTAPEAPLREAQFIDDGGLVRIYAVADGNLALWVLGAPATYRIDPANGEVSEIGREPVLWSPDGTRRVTLHEDGSTTSIRLRDRSNAVTSSVSVTGLVSHVRWASGSNEIVFTLGVVSAGGGVRQDLYVWDLRNRKAPMPLTSNGASFGAEWRGVISNWGP